MPYIIKKKQNCYSVVNKDTGKIYSFCSTKENAQKQKKLLNAIDHGFVPKMRGGGITIEELPTEQILDLLKTLEIKELIKLCFINKRYSKICKKYSKEIFKNILDKFKVDYMDKTNFVYVANNADIQDYVREDNINYYEIFKLYGKFYYDKTIHFVKTNERKDISSFPIYPHMEKCTIHFTSIIYFPSQPRMVYCDLMFNTIENFDIQPRMIDCTVSNNRLSEFKTQPSLEFLKARLNRIEKFHIQPKMKICTISNNLIKDFQIQPRLKILYASHNPIQNLQTQPEMIGCELQSCGLQTVEPQPELICCNFSNNEIQEFTNHENLLIVDLSSNNITTMQQIEYYNVEENPIYESLSNKNLDSAKDVIDFFLLSYKDEKNTLKTIINDFINSNLNSQEAFIRTWFEDNNEWINNNDSDDDSNMDIDED